MIQKVRDNAFIKGKQFNELIDFIRHETILRGGTGIRISSISGFGRTINSEPSVGGFGTIRLAVVKEIPAAAEYVYVNMRNAGTGQEATTGEESNVTAYGLIHNGDRLDLAAPRLKVDDTVMLIKLFYYTGTVTEERWYIIPPFNAGEDYTLA